MTTYPIEVMTATDLPAALDCMGRSFGAAFPPDARARIGAGLELDRMLVVRDGDGVVGTAGAYSLTMTMPGGPQSVAGVTMVSVASTHRRRGILRSLMTRQLGELAAGGEAVAALWASETAIYPHYGYGLGAFRQRFSLPLSGSAFRPGALALAASFDGEGRIRYGSWPADQATLMAVYTAALQDPTHGQRPGMLERPADGRSWHRLVSLGSADPPQIVVAEGPGGPTGYAVFRTRTDASAAADFDRHGEVSVVEITATDPATYAALWRWLLNLDLMTVLVATNRPAPDPITHLLIDHRRLHATIGDCLWLRLVDLPRALAGRSFAAPLDLVIGVSDAGLPANAGSWRVVVPSADSPALVSPATGAPDLSLDIADLGAAHLGAVSLIELALAGRVVEHTPGALLAADRAWSWSPAAWCPEIF